MIVTPVTIIMIQIRFLSNRRRASAVTQTESQSNCPPTQDSSRDRSRDEISRLSRKCDGAERVALRAERWAECPES